MRERWLWEDSGESETACSSSPHPPAVLLLASPFIFYFALQTAFPDGRFRYAIIPWVGFGTACWALATRRKGKGNKQHGHAANAVAEALKQGFSRAEIEGAKAWLREDSGGSETACSSSPYSFPSSSSISPHPGLTWSQTDSDVQINIGREPYHHSSYPTSVLSFLTRLCRPTSNARCPESHYISQTSRSRRPSTRSRYISHESGSK